MLGPIIDLVLLALLILFFGVQQRGRRKLHFKLWFFGWIFIFISLIAWDLAVHTPRQSAIKVSVQFDLLLLGIMFFLASFAPAEMTPLRRFCRSAACYVPAAVCITLQRLTASPGWVFVALIVVSEAIGIYVVQAQPNRRRRAERLWSTALCLVAGAGLIYTALTVTEYLPDVFVGQLLIAASIRYAGSSQSPVPVRLIGALGFMMWGIFHIAMGWVAASGNARMLLTLGELWSIPKYTVAFAMILEIFESQRSELVQFVNGYRELYAEFRLLYDRHPHPMWIHDVATREILGANAAAVQAYGFTLAELLQMKVAQIEAEPPLQPAGDTRTLARHRCADGRLVVVEVFENGIRFQGREARVIQAVDVTEQEQEKRVLLHRANHDVLTDLPNRALVDSRIQECLTRSASTGARFALIALDLDHFKQINDTHGHLLGDEVLRAVADRLRGSVRLADTVGRTGGEEFTALLCDLAQNEDAHRIAALILQSMRQPMQLSDRELVVTVSLGVALYPDDARCVSTLLRLADEALYTAKRNGRNRAVFAANLAQTAAPAPEDEWERESTTSSF